MSEGFLGWFQAISGLVASVGALVVAYVALRQWREATQQRQMELRWRQAEQGRTLINELCSNEGHHAYSALEMTDPRGEPYQVGRATVTHQQVIDALQQEPPTGNAITIQEYFDDLFFYLDLIELFLENHLVTFDDVLSPLEYYAARMVSNRVVYEEYIRELQPPGIREGERPPRALRFLERFRLCSKENGFLLTL